MNYAVIKVVQSMPEGSEFVHPIPAGLCDEDVDALVESWQRKAWREGFKTAIKITKTPPADWLAAQDQPVAASDLVEDVSGVRGGERTVKESLPCLPVQEEEEGTNV